jgi:predicted alpha/beta superfamily hydrolase
MRQQVVPALRALFIVMAIVALAACGGGGSKPEQAQEVGTVTSATLYSAQTGSTYSLDIYLPASYASGAGSYPVIYATEGDASYPPEGRFTNFRRILQRRGTDAILVGIGGTARRSTDFVLPGAEAYHRFITLELVPFIESRFRTDPKRRALSGLSLGGSFVVTSLFFEAPTTLYFSHYLSAEGSFQQASFLAQEQHASAAIGSKSVPATLVLAAGGFNASAVVALHQRLLDRRYVDLVTVQTSFSTDHVGTDTPSFEDAVVRIFESR